MRKNLKKIALCTLLIILLMLPLPVLAAGSAGVSVSSSSVTVGNTVKVTFSFSGGDVYIAGVKAYVSYDSSLLKYSGASGDGKANVASGSGTIVLETISKSKSTLSITMTFSATAAGTAKVSITGSDIVDWDGNTIGSPTASKSITIKEKESSSAGNNDEKPDDEPPESSQIEQPTGIETAIETQIDGSTLYLWKNLDEITLPQDFTIKTIVYNGEQVQAAYREDLDLTLVYFTNAEGANGQFYIYNGYDVFYVYQILTIGQNKYILIQPGEEVVFPEGYAYQQELVNNENVSAWVNPEDTEYCYLYAINEQTQKASIYLYDRQENTLQRINQQMYDLLLESQEKQQEVPVIVQPEPEIVDEKSVIDRILEDDEIMIVVLSIIGISLLIIVVMVSVFIVSGKRRRTLMVLDSQMMTPSEETTEETPVGTQTSQSEETAANQNAEKKPEEDDFKETEN